tara:strand:+ start:528 stop:803 length:276 start_codon:yes stop_codon:yes gene_type:complete
MNKLLSKLIKNYDSFYLAYDLGFKDWLHETYLCSRFRKNIIHRLWDCEDGNSILNIQHKIKLSLSQKYRDNYYLNICDYDPTPCCKYSNKS